MVRIGVETSPGFIFEIMSCSDSETSARLIGPIRPPFAFDGEADASAATLAKSSPANDPRAQRRGLLLRFVLLADVDRRLPHPWSVVGTSIRISRSVTVAGSTNSFLCER